jgi:hypothetical protein
MATGPSGAFTASRAHEIVSYRLPSHWLPASSKMTNWWACLTVKDRSKVVRAPHSVCSDATNGHSLSALSTRKLVG